MVVAREHSDHVIVLHHVEKRFIPDARQIAVSIGRGGVGRPPTALNRVAVGKGRLSRSHILQPIVLEDQHGHRTVTDILRKIGLQPAQTFGMAIVAHLVPGPRIQLNHVHPVPVPRVVPTRRHVGIRHALLQIVEHSVRVVRTAHVGVDVVIPQPEEHRVLQRTAVGSGLVVETEGPEILRLTMGRDVAIDDHRDRFGDWGIGWNPCA